MTRFPKRLQNEFLTRNGMDGILFLYLKSDRNWLLSRAFAMHDLMCYWFDLHAMSRLG